MATPGLQCKAFRRGWRPNLDTSMFDLRSILDGLDLSTQNFSLLLFYILQAMQARLAAWQAQQKQQE